MVQLVGHLTVNEDGVGSSPTAPANSLPPDAPISPACNPSPMHGEILRSAQNDNGRLLLLCVFRLFIAVGGKSAARASADRYGPLGVVLG